MLAEPRWFYDAPTKTMVINLINFTSEGIMGREGIGTVRMKLGETNYTPYSIPSGSSITMIYIPNPAMNYSVAWDNYFTKTLGNNTAQNTGNISDV